MIQRSVHRRRFQVLASAGALALVLAACSSAATPVPTLAPTSAPSAAASSAASTAPSAAAAATVNLAQDAKLGAFLTGPNGKSLYLFTKDSKDKTTCSGNCAASWPPLVVTGSTAPTAGSGVTGTLGTVTRDDGTTQVTYNGIPLYYWAADSKPGDTLGQGVNGVWFLVAPSSTAASGTISGGIGQTGGSASPSAAGGSPAGSTTGAINPAY